MFYVYTGHCKSLGTFFTEQNKQKKGSHSVARMDDHLESLKNNIQIAIQSNQLITADYLSRQHALVDFFNTGLDVPGVVDLPKNFFNTPVDLPGVVDLLKVC